jgi:hypothetical protein
MLKSTLASDAVQCLDDFYFYCPNRIKFSFSNISYYYIGRKY